MKFIGDHKSCYSNDPVGLFVAMYPHEKLDSNIIK